MKQKTILCLLALAFALTLSSFIGSKNLQQKESQRTKDTLVVDSLKPGKLKLFKKNAHASYYAQKFHGRRTASGKRFDNTKYTAAHRKFPFGTRLKVTNEANGKSVIVEITDRGPFTKGRDIDLTKKAFMEIAGNKYGGSLKVTIEEILK